MWVFISFIALMKRIFFNNCLDLYHLFHFFQLLRVILNFIKRSLCFFNGNTLGDLIFDVRLLKWGLVKLGNNVIKAFFLFSFALEQCFCIFIAYSFLNSSFYECLLYNSTLCTFWVFYEVKNCFGCRYRFTTSFTSVTFPWASFRTRLFVRNTEFNFLIPWYG